MITFDQAQGTEATLGPPLGSSARQGPGIDATHEGLASLVCGRRLRPVGRSSVRQPCWLHWRRRCAGTARSNTSDARPTSMPPISTPQSGGSLRPTTNLQEIPCKCVSRVFGSYVQPSAWKGESEMMQFSEPPDPVESTATPPEKGDGGSVLSREAFLRGAGLSSGLLPGVAAPQPGDGSRSFHAQHFRRAHHHQQHRRRT